MTPEWDNDELADGDPATGIVVAMGISVAMIAAGWAAFHIAAWLIRTRWP